MNPPEDKVSESNLKTPNNSSNKAALHAQYDEIRRNPPLVMTIAEVAAYLTCSERKVREDINRRMLTVVRLGGRTLIRLSDLNRDLERLSDRAR